MELEQLRQLDAIEREGTMSAAARCMHVSQPALSRSIQRLEAELGLELFDRIGRRVILNEAGHVAVDWARQILRDEHLMHETMASIRRRERTIRVGTVAPAPLWYLTGLMIERFPEETLTSETLSADGVLSGLLDGTLDLGILPERPNHDNLRSLMLMRESLSVALPPSHPLSARPTLTADELDGETFLITTDIGFWWTRAKAALPRATFIELEDREVFNRLIRSTPHCFFTTDAPYALGDTPGRAVVPLEGAFARAEFCLACRTDATGTTDLLFRWIEARQLS